MDLRMAAGDRGAMDIAIAQLQLRFVSRFVGIQDQAPLACDHSERRVLITFVVNEHLLEQAIFIVDFVRVHHEIEEPFRKRAFLQGDSGLHAAMFGDQEFELAIAPGCNMKRRLYRKQSDQRAENHGWCDDMEHVEADRLEGNDFGVGGQTSVGHQNREQEAHRKQDRKEARGKISHHLRDDRDLDAVNEDEFRQAQGLEGEEYENENDDPEKECRDHLAKKIAKHEARTKELHGSQCPSRRFAAQGQIRAALSRHSPEL